MAKIFVIFMCLIGVTFAAVAQDSKPIESNAAAVAAQISPEDKNSGDDDLETAEFKHLFRPKLAYAVPVAVPVAPVYVQPVPVHVPVQPVHHVHTPDCGCNGGGYNQGGHSYGYNYNYHYNY
ncbi:hypothetical protein HA402_015343 [Bradysia odoriphaga]|nr:hypothetical protein HA402_015343 [Bradysia odoriphaga]